MKVLEKNKSFGMETSSRNSGVIHAGLYYPPSSLKSQLCIDGNSLLYDYCKKKMIGHAKMGKLVVSSNETVEKVFEIYENARQMGLDVELLGRSQIEGMEPLVKSSLALLSRSTGIIDSHELMSNLEADCNVDGDVVCGSEVIGIERVAHGFEVTVNQNGTDEVIQCSILINSAGL